MKKSPLRRSIGKPKGKRGFSQPESTLKKNSPNKFMDWSKFGMIGAKVKDPSEFKDFDLEAGMKKTDVLANIRKDRGPKVYARHNVGAWQIGDTTRGGQTITGISNYGRPIVT